MPCICKHCGLPLLNQPKEKRGKGIGGDYATPGLDIYSRAANGSKYGNTLKPMRGKGNFFKTKFYFMKLESLKWGKFKKFEVPIESLATLHGGSSIIKGNTKYILVNGFEAGLDDTRYHCTGDNYDKTIIYPDGAKKTYESATIWGGTQPDWY